MVRVLLALSLAASGACGKDAPAPAEDLQKFSEQQVAAARAKEQEAEQAIDRGIDQAVDQAHGAAHAAKVKALEVAQLAAREAEAAADAASAQAEKAKREMRAAKDELAKTTAERGKLADEGRALLASARAKLTAMESQLAKMMVTRDEAKAAFSKMTDGQKQNAAARIAEMDTKIDEAAEQLKRLRATMEELAKSLPP